MVFEASLQAPLDPAITSLQISTVICSSNALIILSFSFSIAADCSQYSFDLINPHKKKSQGVKSGERGGEGMFEESRPSSDSASLYPTRLEVFDQNAGVPSCISRILLLIIFSSTEGQNESMSNEHVEVRLARHVAL